jgi:2,3,4,5-tetrahydropyridine-2-carboxylate N-succinyltransferase
MNLLELRVTIEHAWERRDTLSASDTSVRAAVLSAIDLLDSGKARVAEPTDSGWQVNDWLKKAVLLFFRLHDNIPIEMGALSSFDKVPLKFEGWTAERLTAHSARASCRPPPYAKALTSPAARC